MSADLARRVALLERAVFGSDAWPRTSRRRDAPAGVSPRMWSKLAARIGRKPHEGARFYLVERSAWDAWLETRTPRSAPAAPAASAWSPATAAKDVALRATKGT